MTSPDRPYNPNDSGTSLLAIITLMLSLATFCSCGASFILAGLAVPFLFLFSVAGIVTSRMEIGRIERGESPSGGKMIVQIGFFYCLANLIISLLVGVVVALAAMDVITAPQ